MSQQDNFAGGFIIGSIVGGVVGGIMGTVLASRSEKNRWRQGKENALESGKPIQFDTEEDMEIARQSLEDKITQLNLAIDDVRQQLGSVNGNAD